jgi:hypothetical protein
VRSRSFAKTGKELRLSVCDTKAVRHHIGSGHGHDAATSRERGRSDRIGRERKTPDGPRTATSLSGDRHGPGVLVWPDIFGLRPAFRQMSKRLAEWAIRCWW